MFEILFANWGPPCRALVDHVDEAFSIFFLVYRCMIGFAVLPGCTEQKGPFQVLRGRGRS